MGNMAILVGIVVLMIIINDETAAVPTEKKLKYCKNQLPCPSCATWCKNNEDYNCKYSCELEEPLNVNYGDKSACFEENDVQKYNIIAGSYPMCDRNFKPYDKGAEKDSTNAPPGLLFDEKPRVGFAYTQIFGNSKNAPPDDYITPYGIGFFQSEHGVWVTWYPNIINGGFKKFHEWCGMQCINGRLLRSTHPKHIADNYFNNISSSQLNLFDTKSSKMSKSTEMQKQNITITPNADKMLGKNCIKTAPHVTTIPTPTKHHKSAEISKANSVFHRFEIVFGMIIIVMFMTKFWN
uniref:Uncharacterized protein n=1 Tax=Meloidogyne javanica TaxID=6303 RepID=A0A915M241_MELJA